MLADDQGNVVTLDTMSGEWCERIGRAAVVAMGGTAAVVDPVYSGREMASRVVPGSLTRTQQDYATTFSGQSPPFVPSSLPTSEETSPIRLPMIKIPAADPD
ncbi:hypothetical protein [Streptomyces sp. NPDC048191]|uniref:S-methyl thiohydantoin desulfurase domain-containing protein n=1 Tax=Streptomyces sp. NPDC048191 TaxID=3155484 RepID=UPI00340A1206